MRNAKEKNYLRFQEVQSGACDGPRERNTQPFQGQVALPHARAGGCSACSGAAAVGSAFGASAGEEQQLPGFQINAGLQTPRDSSSLK